MPDYIGPYGRYVDEYGRDVTAKRRTFDGRAYPVNMLASWGLPPIRFSDGPPSPAQVLDIPMVAIHCGPDAPYPLVPTPEQILDAAVWYGLPRTNEDRERRELRVQAEDELWKAMRNPLT